MRMHHAHIDKFAYSDSPIHRLDSRVKLLAVAVFTVFVLAVPRYSVSVLACYAIGPFVMLVVGHIPLRFVLRHILTVSPFVLVLAASCPLYNREVMGVEFGPFSWTIGRGWVQFANILGKFIITMAALITLVCTTRFSDLLAGMAKMGMPQVLVNQLGFLYRYIFVLIDKAHHILRARSSRKLRNLGFTTESKTAGAMIGTLFILSLESSERINIAMQARGFDGEFRTINKLQMRKADFLFVAIATIFLLGIGIWRLQ
ncbi:MAG: cobalt ECF transporter T component CbiQ [Sedimentisphaerales bacterium]|nr:cobalt ECF transporter T component CbiQ [Sedimentisphaerales bacterium]